MPSILTEEISGDALMQAPKRVSSESKENVQVLGVAQREPLAYLLGASNQIANSFTLLLTT